MKLSEFRRNIGKKCAVTDCDRPARTHLWCQKHYSRWQRHGDPLALKHHKTHGDTTNKNKAPEYPVWCTMIARCHNPNNLSFDLYGGRGITVCPEWRSSYTAFLSSVGRRPGPSYMLDRVNNEGNYEPGNVRWITATEQARNRRSNRLLTVDGVTRCIAEWAEVTGIPSRTISLRLGRGWDVRSAVFIKRLTHKGKRHVALTEG